MAGRQIALSRDHVWLDMGGVSVARKIDPVSNRTRRLPRRANALVNRHC
jgi:hypothetical protein